MESSDPVLYYWIHPNNIKHNMLKRLQALQELKEIGYQTGSGFMIGLPGQTIDQMADDLIFLKDFDVDMAGMGPYIEHNETPMFAYHQELPSKEERLQLSLLMIAVLRIIMPDINIASSTALDSLSPNGRLLAIKAGANVLMPNLTPIKYREGYFLYDNKPYLTEAQDLIARFENSDILNEYSIGFGEWGDSRHYAASRKL
jgi:biotin synthase